MSDQRKFQNLALIGFMGTGKSCVGRIVAAHLHYQFLDTDHMIEARAGKPISRIFAEAGEPVFRELERLVVQELEHMQSTVIATGGGLCAHADNLQRIKSHSLVVCLWASPEKIFQRVRSQAHRPLLHTHDPAARIRELLEARRPFYRQADVLINTETRSVKEVAFQVMHQYRLARTSPKP